MTVFTNIPSAGSRGSRLPAVRIARFLNQFEQREIDAGVGSPVSGGDLEFRLSDLMLWELQFLNRPATELDTIAQFLEALGGADKFLWTPPTPYDVLGQRFYVCDKWDWTYEGGGVVAGISATFQELPPIP
jgi:phage-related protein